MKYSSKQKNTCMNLKNSLVIVTNIDFNSCFPCYCKWLHITDKLIWLGKSSDQLTEMEIALFLNVGDIWIWSDKTTYKYIFMNILWCLLTFEDLTALFGLSKVPKHLWRNYVLFNWITVASGVFVTAMQKYETT